MNENKFTGKAGIYSKYRPSYPESFISYLFTTAGLNKESIIADVGSGTGILTELLLKRGCLVYGVEPNKDMQSEAINKLSGYNSFIPVNASAENTTLPDKTVDFITSAQAFHWFDTHKFRAECNRIMRKWCGIKKVDSLFSRIP